MIKTNKDCQREFLIAMNYAYKYGSFKADDLEEAEAEFGEAVNRKLGLVDTDTEYGTIDLSSDEEGEELL
jgi:hypothetical protein